MKKLIVLFAVTTAIMITTGCSSGIQETNHSPSAPMEDYPDYADGAFEESAVYDESLPLEQAQALDANLKIIRNSEIEMETDDLIKTLDYIKNYAAQCGGYVENLSLDSYTHRNQEVRNAFIVIRVPGQVFDQAVSSITEGNKILAQYENTENVTMRYIDFEGQLKVKRMEEERLLELVAQAQSIEAIITLETRLSEVRGDIEYITGTLRSWDDLVRYSTIRINLVETPIETVSQSYGITQQAGSAFAKSINEAGDFCAAVAVFIIRHWIKLIILGIIALFFIKKNRWVKNPVKNWLDNKGRKKEGE